METNPNILYDCIIIGGGLAGLCLSIQLVKSGHTVCVIEKNSYPFHKVCGEYISMESWDFLESLGLPLSEFNLPIINQLNITSHKGYKISSALQLGGFGISRYTLDFELSKLCKKYGVTVLENCKATDVNLLANDVYTIVTTQNTLQAKLVCGSYGKITPSFITTKQNEKGKYIGVKYHIKTIFPDDLIELHNFKDGYCGISKIDNETYCLCYLTTTKNLQENGNDIRELEKNVLMQNPYLKKYFSESEFLFKKPLSISKISFNKKNCYQNGILLLGDSAGAIAPLCGNGMSIGMRSSKFLAYYISSYLNNKLSKQQLVIDYTKTWNSNFSLRIKTGYYLQHLLGKQFTTLVSLKILNYFPSLFKSVIKLTHGEKF